ncbi:MULTISPECIES: permease-like cell division protein FtsX [Embleya]|uniref:Cell division protein FtsX n=2 Tax=Embleya TaxID=2699295 RepID=A0A1T3P0Y0_9ACTN|nr:MULTISPECIES: permease-like cell division protein FtsX [Embleya]OPC82748.1 cell division protein FtsX [Embleya scabrispora]GCE02050.1 cell division protein FtsX [Embleya hyalina]
MRAQFVLSEIGVGLRRNLTMTIAVIVSVALSLTLAGAGLLLRVQVNEMKDFWYDRVEVSIFLCGKSDHGPGCEGGEVSNEQREGFRAELSRMPLVEKTYYETKQEAFQHFKEQNKESPISGSVTADQLPESFRVKLKDPTKYQVVASAFQGRPGVQSVQDQRKILEPFFKLLKNAQWAALGVMVFMLLVAILLIVNTARVSAFSRRRETGIMRLVGASNLYIQLPFIMESAIAGLLGGLMATGLLSAGFYFGVKQGLGQQFSAFDLIGWGPVLMTLPWLIVFGAVMSAIASFFTLLKYLKV